MKCLIKNTLIMNSKKGKSMAIIIRYLRMKYNISITREDLEVRLLKYGVTILKQAA